jgi:hypothetical protein
LPFFGDAARTIDVNDFSRAGRIQALFLFQTDSFVRPKGSKTLHLINLYLRCDFLDRGNQTQSSDLLVDRRLAVGAAEQVGVLVQEHLLLEKMISAEMPKSASSLGSLSCMTASHRFLGRACLADNTGNLERGLCCECVHFGEGIVL